MKAKTDFSHPSHRGWVGYLLVAMIVSVIAREFIPWLADLLLLIAILGGWGAAALVVTRVGAVQRCVVGAMILTGIVALGIVQQRGANAPWVSAVSQSLPLVTMIMSVGFLKRIALRAISAEATLPTGFKAYRDTAFMLIVFGGFINISSVIITADRLSQRVQLTQQSASLLTRTFSSCVNWSPFFAGLAVVISYSPAFSVQTVILQGVPLALIGVALVIFNGWRRRTELTEFRGFPVQWSSLWIPSLLALVVLVFRLAFESVSLLSVIALSALSVVVVFLVLTEGFKSTAATLHSHITEDLPLGFNELTLLLGVGVMATGLLSWVELGDVHWQPPAFTGTTAIAIVAIMVVVAMTGIHPVVSIAIITSFLIPVQPNPELLATALLFGWNIGTLACPLSGLHLVMQGRYGVPSWQSAIDQLPYVAVLFTMGAAWLQILAVWHNV